MTIIHKRGFSITELLITLVIFSCGLLPLIFLFQSSHKQTAQAKNLMIAHSLGRTIISEIRSLGYDVLENEIDNHTLGIAGIKEGITGPLVSVDNSSIVYPESYKRFKTNVKLVPENNIIRIELDVSWKEPNRNFDLGFGTVVVKYDN